MSSKCLFAAALSLMIAVMPAFSADNQKREMKFNNVLKQFENPGREFRTAPLWVWNTTVTEADIDRMLEEYRDQGFGGAFVHPRPGLETEYLSDEWFRLWRYSVEKGKELGLDIWIYDENSYPSGFAGGYVPDQMPESYNQGIGLRPVHLKEAPKPGEHYMCLKKKASENEFELVTDKLDQLQGQPGEYTAYDIVYADPSPWTAGFPYVDLLVKGVTEKFIDVTMSGYEKEFGKELGTVVKGIFTDEPNLQRGSKGIRWSPDLFDAFEEFNGYDLRPGWPFLTEISPRGDKLRHDYYLTLHRLMVERWSKPWHEYTEKHKLLWTGHYWEHAWPAVNGVPDNMAMYVWHQQPAIDMLRNDFNPVDPNAQFGNVRSVKELASVANQMGYVRTLSETYGAGGWDERFVDFKRLGDWEYVLGVNFMNQHLSHMTITGSRKYDFPPEFTAIEPWWQDYRVLNDYFARLSLALSQGVQVNGWLVIEPVTSLWLSQPDTKAGRPRWDCANGFQEFVTRLETAQVEYDLGSENIMRDIARVGRKGLKIGRRTYGTVILPPGMRSIETSTLKLLEKFVANGGRLIVVQRPDLLDARADESKLAGLFDNPAVTRLGGAEEVIDCYNTAGGSGFSEISGSLLFHHRRQYRDGQLVFAVNSSLEEKASARLSVSGRYLYRIDPMDGKVYDCNFDRQKAAVCADVELEPAGSVMYFASRRKLKGAVERPDSAGSKIVAPVGGTGIKVLGDNILNIDFCRLQVDDMVFPELFTKDACNELWKCFGWANDPWTGMVQYKRNILDKDNFPAAAINVDYHFTVADDIDFSKVHFIIERPDVWKVSLNGFELSCTQDRLIDSRCGDYASGGHVVKGDNVITLHRDRMSVHAEPSAVLVLGDFGVYPAEPGWTIGKAPEALTLGSWADQGYPEYAWTVSYSHDYDLSPAGKACSVRLGEWNGTVSEVWVNGAKAGIIAFPPYSLDVTSALREGRNTVEVRVVGSMRNVYGPHHTRKTGGTWSSEWNGIGGNHLPGAAYNIYPYGLEEDFELVTCEMFEENQ